MVEGKAYKRWFVRYHDDGRPPSIAFGYETRRKTWYHTMPGNQIVRGDPYR